MKIISFDGYTFSSGGYICGIRDGDMRGQWSLQPSTLPRLGASSLLAGTSITARPIPVTFGYDGGVLSYENAFLQLMGKLDPTNSEPRTLVAQLNDGTTVQCPAIVMLPAGQTGDDDEQRPSEIPAEGPRLPADRPLDPGIRQDHRGARALPACAQARGPPRRRAPGRLRGGGGR